MSKATFNNTSKENREVKFKDLQPKEWQEKLIELAKEYNLTVPEVEACPV